MNKKKILLIILAIGCLLVIIGCTLKLISSFDNNKKESNVVDKLSVSKAISGDFGYYEEDDKLVVVYEAENKAPHDVTIEKIRFTLEEMETGKKIYEQSIKVGKTLKANSKKEIVLRNIERNASDLQDYVVKIEAQ